MAATGAVASASDRTRRPLAVRLSGTVSAVLGCWRLAPVLVALVMAGCAGPTATVPASPTAPPADLLIVIPRGAAAAEMRGEVSVAVPPVIQLRAGQRVLIQNDDVAMHYFLQSPIAPGQTLARSFDQPGRHAFSGVQSCSVGQLTSLIVDVAPHPTPSRSRP